MYTLDTGAAKEADSFSSYITEVGKYVGTIIQAYSIESSKKTKGIVIEFESDSKQIANFNLWIEKETGEKVYGYKQLMALMACLKLRNLDTKSGNFEAYDANEKKRVNKAGLIFPDLMNKKIGLLIETEEYQKNNGDIGIKPIIKAFFQHDTELMATEILNQQTKPEQLSKVIQTLKHYPLKTTIKENFSNATGVAGLAAMDDDIPF